MLEITVLKYVLRCYISRIEKDYVCIKIYLMIMYVISKQIIQTSGLYNGDKFLQAINNIM